MTSGVRLGWRFLPLDDQMLGRGYSETLSQLLRPLSCLIFLSRGSIHLKKKRYPDQEDPYIQLL